MEVLFIQKIQLYTHMPQTPEFLYNLKPTLAQLKVDIGCSTIIVEDSYVYFK